MSYHKLTHKPLNASLNTLMKRAAHVGVGIGAFTPILVLANPTGGQVVAGQANITAQNANSLVIKQASQSAIINWQQFSIGSGQYVQFLQPSSSSVVLNRVVGGNATSILGNLTANGQVFLVNPNGIFFGKGANLDVQGIVASTLDIANNDFMAGNYVFDKGTGSDASVVNQGNIQTRNGGYVVLAGDYAENDGLIQAQSGHIILASGTRTTLTLNGNRFVNFAVNDATLAKLAGTDNTGSLIADGGTVIMTADVANQLKATVVNNTGLIEAQAIAKGTGAIYLTATGGNIINAGTLDADAAKVGQAGGDIILKGDAETDLTSTSKISATGLAANGGYIELSGKTLNVRGTADIGKGGNMLLDPDKVTLVTGVASSGASKGTAAGGNDDIGLTFIQNALNGGGNVAISAHSVISHSANAKAITATTGAGNLKFNVGTGGHIELAGLTIDIAGNMLASGAGASMSFGRLTAKSIALSAGSTGKVQLTEEGVVSGMAKLSATATAGHIFITAGHINALNSGSLNLKATGSIDLHGSVDNHGNVGISAGGGISASKIISTNGNVKLTAKSYETNTNSFVVDAETPGGNITIKGAIGTSTARFDGNVILDAGNNISLDHGIYLNASDAHIHNLSITGKHLAYTGVGAFVLSAGYGTMLLEASIGSAAAPAKYAVKLQDFGYGIYIDRSIYTAGSIAINQDNLSSLVGTGSGAYIRNSGGKAVTLSAKGPISMEGERVAIGGSAAITVSADDGKASTTGDKLTITAKQVYIAGYNAAATIGEASVNHSVTLHAGNNVSIDGSSFAHIGSGGASAHANGAAATLTAINNVTITAGNDVDLTGSDVVLGLGYAYATIASDTKAKVVATVEANTSITAGHDINITAVNKLSASGGAALAEVVTHASHQNATANVSADLTLSAGHSVGITAPLVSVRGGTARETSFHSSSFNTFTRGHDSVVAAQSGAKAAANAHADVSISAGDGLSITATAGNLVVAGGDGAGGAGTHYYSFSCCDSGADTRTAAQIKAGKNASAALTATANASFKAGAGGITLAATGNLEVSGGYGVAQGIVLSAASLGGAKVSANDQSKVSLSATGSLKLTSGRVILRGGADAAARVNNHYFSFSSSISSYVAGKIKASKGDSVVLTANAGLSLTAGANLTVSAASSAYIFGASAAGLGLKADVSGVGAAANATVQAGVTLAAGGKVKLLGIHQVAVTGGQALGEENSLQASIGALNVNENTAVSITAGKSLTVTGTTTIIEGGNDLGVFDVVKGSDAATVNVTVVGTAALAGSAVIIGSAAAPITQVHILGPVAGVGDSIHASDAAVTMTAQSQVSIHATGALTLTAAKFAGISAGSQVGGHLSVIASHGGHATVSANGGVSLVAGGNISLTGGSSAVGLKLMGGKKDGSNAIVSAYGGAISSLDALSSLDVVAGGNLTISARGNLLVQAGPTDVALRVQVDGYDNGQAAMVAGAGVTLTGGGKVSLTTGGNKLSIAAAGGAVASEGAAEFATAKASYGGKASLTANVGVNINAGAGFSADMTGATGKGSLLLLGANSDARSATASATHLGKATLNMNAAVNLAVTGALTLNAGSYSGGGTLELAGRAANARSADAIAKSGGVASLKADAGVNLKATGAITLETKKTGIDLAGGSAYNGYGASALGSGNKAVATLTADGALTISGASLTLNAAGEVDIYAGYYNGDGADAKAYDGGKGTLLADDSVDIHVSGALSAKGSSVHLWGGYLENGYDAKASADTSGAATLTANGALNITAGGNVSMTATGAASSKGVDLAAGYHSNGLDAYAYAEGTKAAATLTAEAAISISANNITMKALGYIDDYAGYYNGDGAYAEGNNGATASLTADVGINLTAKGVVTASGDGLDLYGAYSKNAYKAYAYAGNHGTATLTATGIFNITAGGNISLNGGAGSMYVDAGHSYNAYGGYASAANSATAKTTANASVNISAGGSVTLTNTGDMYVIGGYIYNGAKAYAEASGTKAVASFTAQSTVNISGGSISMKGGDIDDYAGYYNAYSAGATGINGGAATLVDNDGINFTAKGNFTASGAAGLGIYGGYSEGGYYAYTTASHQGAATLTASGVFNIKAGGNLVLKGGTGGVSIEAAYDYNGAYAHAVGESGGIAKTTVNAGIDLTAGGSITATAGEGLDVLTAYKYQAYEAYASAGYGATATVAINSAVHIAAGGAVSLTAGASHDLSIGVGGATTADDAYDAKAIAVHQATATFTESADVDIAAGGAFTVTAGGSLAVYADRRYHAYSASATADSASKATLTASGTVNVTAASITLQAKTGDLSIYGGSNNGYAAEDHASNATANLTADAGVNLKAVSGNLNLIAGGNLFMAADDYVGYDDSVTAYHNGHATLVANNALNLSGKAVNLTASGSDLSIHGGYEAGRDVYADASTHGVANFTADASVNISAVSGFTATQKGGGLHSPKLFIYGGSSALDGASVAAYGGTATLSADTSVNIAVSAGGITLKNNGTKSSGEFSIYGGGDAAANGEDYADLGGTATVTATGHVDLTAAGAVNLKYSHGAVLVYAGGNAGGSAAVNASGSGAHATVSADGSVNVQGASVSLTAGLGLSLYGGFAAEKAKVTALGAAATATLIANDTLNITAATGAVTVLAGHKLDVYASSGNAESADVKAYSHGVAALTAAGGVNIKAASAISLTGDTGVTVAGASDSNAKGANAYASSGGVAKLTASDAVNLTAGSVKLDAVTGKLSIYGGDNNAADAVVTADYHGAMATLTAKGGVSIHGSAVAMTAGSILSIEGGQKNGSLADVTGSHGGVGTLTATTGVTIVATGALTAIATGNLRIQTSSLDGKNFHADASGDGGKATGTANNAVSLSGASVTLLTHGNLKIDAGSEAGAGAMAGASHDAAAKLTVNDSVLIHAGSNLSLTLNGGNLSIVGGGVAGRSAHVLASGASAAANEVIDANINLLAVGSITVAGADDILRYASNFAAPVTVVQSVGGGAAGATVDQSVTLSGTAITLHHTGTSLTHNASNAVSAGGLVQLGKVNTVIHASGVTPTPLSVGPFTLEVKPLESAMSFGQAQTMADFAGSASVAPVDSVSLTSVPEDGVTVTPDDAAAGDLGTLANQGLVTQLATQVAAGLQPQQGIVPVKAAFVSAVDMQPCRDAQPEQCLTVRLTSVGNCLALK